MKLSLQLMVPLALAIGSAAAAEPRDVPELMPGVPAGYLPTNELPDSRALLPPPPERDSAAFQYDEDIHRRAAALRGTPRWNLAARDADLHPPQALGLFDCALGIAVDPKATPRLYQLLQRVMVDTGLSTSAAKKRYQATRPFVLHHETTCTPAEEEELRRDGSYPSGHSALGMGAALVLAELAPDRADALLARGRSYGESRVVCNVHWESDVIEGRFMAAATVARLHAEPEFVEDTALAKAEIAAARQRGDRPTRDCKAEADALRQSVPGAM